MHIPFLGGTTGFGLQIMGLAFPTFLGICLFFLLGSLDTIDIMICDKPQPIGAQFDLNRKSHKQQNCIFKSVSSDLSEHQVW